MDLATELLHELKSTSRRWFILFIIMLLLLFATNISWAVAWEYSDTSAVTVDSVTGNASYVRGAGSILNYIE